MKRLFVWSSCEFALFGLEEENQKPFEEAAGETHFLQDEIQFLVSLWVSVSNQFLDTFFFLNS